MAIYDWSNTVTQWHFNPENVRDPTLIFNNVSIPYGTAPGYDNTPYAVSPINFAPNVNVPKASQWTTIPLDQFGVPLGAKMAVVTVNAGMAGVNMWKGAIYAWFRRPGSSWALSPIFDGGVYGSTCLHVPIGNITKPCGTKVPAVEMAWGTNGLDPTNWGTGRPCTDTPWFTAILSGWAE